MFSLNKKKKSIWERYPVLHTIDKDKFPGHICIIPDGNGRYAQRFNSFVLEGHKKGATVIKNILRDLSEIPQIRAVTIWGFSSDNWKRSEREVGGLMKILENGVKETLIEIEERYGKFIHLGRKDRIPESLLKTLKNAEKETKSNLGQIVALAIDFGGEDQIIRMLQKAREWQGEITQETLWALRDGNGIVKAADLLIRTANEKRTSDIGWLNGAPTELYVIKKLFPEITIEDIIEGIIDFSKRDRRLGGRKV